MENAAPVQAVEAATRGLGLAVGASAVSFLVADLSGRTLVRLTYLPLPDGPKGDALSAAVETRSDLHEVATTVPLVEGGPVERALRLQTVQVTAVDDADGHGGSSPAGWKLLAPVTERGEALGLLELTLPTEPGPAVVEEVARTAHLLAFVVIASRRHTDLYEWGQRTVPFSLPAEIQRRLLPPAFTCDAGSFTLSAWLEPADNVGGDTFDYSVARDVLHLSITDAMGHGVASSLTATLCVGSLRNTRRYGCSLLEQAREANEALLARTTEGLEGFATGLLGRLDLVTGVLALVNAGHAAPYLLRAGEVTVLDLPADVPLGMFSGTAYRSTDLQLVRGDRLVLVTDGMLERNATRLDLPDLIRQTADAHPREATRALADLVLEATGHALADDATLLIVDWHGHHGEERDTLSGSDVTLD